VQSDDSLWRRVALICTVTLNTRGEGGTGDAPRTLALCALRVGDSAAIVSQALSVALRALVHFDSRAVSVFLDEHENRLPAKVHREVTKKLTQVHRSRTPR